MLSLIRIPLVMVSLYSKRTLTKIEVMSFCRKMNVTWNNHVKRIKPFVVPTCYVGTWDLIYIEAMEVEVSRMTEGIMAGERIGRWYMLNVQCVHR